MKRSFRAARSGVIFFLLFLISQAAFGRMTVLTFQGRLIDSSSVQPTNGSYEMQFKAFDSMVGGNHFGSTVTIPAVQVVNGFSQSISISAPRPLEAKIGSGRSVFVPPAARIRSLYFRRAKQNPKAEICREEK